MEYYKYLRQYVGKQPVILPGAVVLIFNSKGEVLLQKRRDGGWGLPGGLMDMGESLEETAAREVFEETGLTVDALELVHVFSGEDHFCQAPTGDEFYSLTAVYSTSTATGEMQTDLREAEEHEYFSLESLPEGLGRLYRQYVEFYRNIVA